MPLVAEAVWQVLIEGPATGDVENLHPPADAQHRNLFARAPAE